MVSNMVDFLWLDDTKTQEWEKVHQEWAKKQIPYIYLCKGGGLSELARMANTMAHIMQGRYCMSLICIHTTPS